METYLNKERAKGVRYVRKPIVAREIGANGNDTLAMLSELCEEGILAAKVKVSCPDCGTQHGGVYNRQSEVPNQKKVCMCGSEFRMGNRSNWRVVYEIPEDDLDFFLSIGERLKIFNESADDLPRSFFEQQFEELENYDNPQHRGQIFDYFLGLLFQQLDGAVVKCRYNEDNPGELDVIANFSQGPEWAFKSLGCATGVENKWEKDSASLGDIAKFDSKLQDLHERQGTRVGFFVSMEGYTEDAQNELNGGIPRMIGFRKQDIQQMVKDATAKNVIQDSIFY